jgi:hypothetical protein
MVTISSSLKLPQRRGLQGGTLTQIRAENSTSFKRGYSAGDELIGGHVGFSKA